MFEMGAKFDDGWSCENGDKKELKKEIRSYKDHKLHFFKEKRRGKIVTIVKPFFLDAKDMQIILKSLKKKLAIGGSIKDNSMEFQGDVKDRLDREFIELGFNLK